MTERQSISANRERWLGDWRFHLRLINRFHRIYQSTISGTLLLPFGDVCSTVSNLVPQLPRPDFIRADVVRQGQNSVCSLQLPLESNATHWYFFSTKHHYS